MYSQLFLGVWFLINAGLHYFNVKFLINKSVRTILSEQELVSYQKGFVLPDFLIGTLFIIMGIVEKMALLSTPVFIVVYVMLALFPLWLILKNNKKHSGYYFW